MNFLVERGLAAVSPLPLSTSNVQIQILII